MACGPEPEKNLEHASDLVREAAGRGAQIVCLPELFMTQYFCQREDPTLFDLAEPIPGPTTTRLSVLARTQRIVLVAALFEKRSYQHNPLGTRQDRQAGGGRPGNGFSQIEEGGVLALAEVLGHEQLRQANDLGAAPGRFAHQVAGMLEIFLGLRPARHLHQTNPKYLCHLLPPAIRPKFTA